MATYPRFWTLSDSTCTPQGGQDQARATNGTLRVRRFWPDTKRDWSLHHILTLAERDQLDAFYAANRDADVSYISPWDRLTYSTRFVAAPAYVPRGQHFEARVQLSEA